MKIIAFRTIFLMFGIILVALTILPLSANAFDSGIITAIDQKTGLVTAKDGATGNNFQFKVNGFQPIDSVKMMEKYRVGQKVFVNFKSGNVSLDGKKTCCRLVGGSQGTKNLNPGSLRVPGGSGSVPQGIQGSASDAGEACKQESQKHSNLICVPVQDADTTDAGGNTVHNWHCECTGAGTKPTVLSPNSSQP